METDTIIQADITKGIPLPDKSVHCVVTSPPYWGLRDYGVAGQLGLEKTPEEFIERMVKVFREVWRVLRDDGTCWLNMGDSYAGSGKGVGEDYELSEKQASNTGANFLKTEKKICGYCKKEFVGNLKQRFCSPECGGQDNTPNSKKHGLKPKDLCGIPWRLAFALQGFAVVPFRSFSVWADELKIARELQDWEAVQIVEGKLRRMDFLAGLQADGWYLRQDIIWKKPSPMPESVRDRCTKAHEYIFLMTKKPRYWYDAEAIKEEASTEPHAFGYSKENLDSRRESIVGSHTKGTQNNPSAQTKVVAENGTRNKRSVWTADDLTDFVKWIIETHPEIDVNEYFDIEKKDVWTVPTAPYSEAHFATFPPKLIEPCILAGCPEWVCKKCGEPRRRILSKGGYEPPLADDGERFVDKSRGDKTRKLSGAEYNKAPKPETTGWTDCGCGADFDGGIVLDPFMGSGTVGLVAYQNNRHYIGIELNPEYCELGRIEKERDKYALLE